jgi:hypothetical protein
MTNKRKQRRGGKKSFGGVNNGSNQHDKRMMSGI